MTKHITLRLLELSIKYGYYSGGTTFYWNSRLKQIHLVQRNDSYRWIIGLVLSIVFSCTILCGTIYHLLCHAWYDWTRFEYKKAQLGIKNDVALQNPSEGGQHHEIEHSLQLLVLVGCIASSLLHLNLVVKRKEIVTTMNRCLGLISQLEELKSEPCWNNGEMILAAAFLLSLITPFLSLNIYWTDFQLWLKDPKISETPPTTIAFCIAKLAAQLYFLTITCSVVLLYFVLTYPFLYFGSEHFKILLSEGNHRPHRHKRIDGLVRNYRSLQLLIACEESCLGSYTLPGHLIILTTACIVSLNALIRVSMAFAQFAFLLTIISGYVLHLLTGVKEASLLPQLARMFFSAQHRKRRGGLLTRRYLNSFPPLTIGLGALGRLDRNMYTWILSTCVNFAVGVVLIE